MKFLPKALTDYAKFNGRASILEFWTLMGLNIFIILVLPITLHLTFPDFLMSSAWGAGLLLTILIYSLYVLTPTLAVSVRRLHDTSKSAWWLLLYLIPTLGALIFAGMMMDKSTPGSNKYGDEVS